MAIEKIISKSCAVSDLDVGDTFILKSEHFLVVENGANKKYVNLKLGTFLICDYCLVVKPSTLKLVEM